MTTTYLQKLRLFNRDVRLALLTYATCSFSYTGIISVLLNLYLLRLGYGPEFIGLVNGAGWLVFTVSCLPAGALGKRWGRRTMIAGVSLIVAGYGLLPLVELMPSALWDAWLLVTNSLAYLGGGLWLVNTAPFLADVTSSEERDHAFSLQTAVTPLAGFAGNLVGGFLPGLLAPALGVSLDAAAPYRYPLLMAAAACGLVALPALVATRDVRAEGTSEVQAKGGRVPYGPVTIMALVRLLWPWGAWAAYIFFNVYLDTALAAPTSLVGTLAAIGKLVGIPAVLSTPVLMKRLGKGHTVVWASVGVAVGLLPLALLPHWGAAGLGLAVVGTADLITAAAYSVYSQEIVRPAWRAVMSGTTFLAFGLGSSILSFGGGYVIAALGYRFFFLLGAAVTVAGALLMWAYLRVLRKESS